jgi:hypothetical protein
LHRADDATLWAEIAGDVGRPPPYELGAFDDLDDAVRAAIRFSRTGTASVASCTTSIPAACAKWSSNRGLRAASLKAR